MNNSLDIYTTAATKPPPLTSQQLHRLLGYDPLSLEKTKHRYPQISSYIVVEQKMVDGFPVLFVHATPVHHYNVSFPQVIQGQNLSKRYCPNEESHSQRGLLSPNALQRERKALRGLST